MKKQKIILSILILMVMVKNSCINQTKVYNHTANIVELGNNYYYLADGKESQILLNLKPEGRSKFGKTIVPPEVILFNFDKNFIVAKTINKINGNEYDKYWVVDKAKDNQDKIIPLDSISFYEMTDSLQIKIKLEPRK